MRKKPIITGFPEKQSELLNRYITFVQGIAYEATEDCSIGKFEEFNDLINNIVKYTETFRQIVETEKQINEWAYMIPNLTLYSAMGFFVGVKNKKNRHYIDSLSEELFERTLSVVSDTTDILVESKRKKERIEKIKIIHKERNEHNSKS
mgnify:CR=1 FL=1|tara:strand:+ start:136 stop:582 length:447 start_codon:yes stop_codon:yes gene_type:complete